MSEVLPQDNIFELPEPVGDSELDRVIDHARKFGRCLFNAGDHLIELVLNEDDTVGMRT